MNSINDPIKMTTIDSIDAEWLRSIVCQVVSRLESQSVDAANAAPSPETYSGKLVTLETMEQWARSQRTEIKIGTKTVVTPAAMDEAKQHGITITRGETGSRSQRSADRRKDESTPTEYEISDSQDPQRAGLIRDQLRRRNANGSAVIVSSDTPAIDVFRLCSEKRRAVMVADIASVERFENELRPDVWVLDMKKLNLIAAVNAAQKILEHVRRL